MAEESITVKTDHPLVDGFLTFPCCSTKQVVAMHQEAYVRCPKCGTTYQVRLQIRPLESPYSRGTRVRVKESGEYRVGSNQVLISGGTIGVVHTDPYNVIPRRCGEDAVLLFFPWDEGELYNNPIVKGLLVEVPIRLVEEVKDDPGSAS